ncbi:hypothetical protein, partial [Vibrio parahaemolyticus]
INCIFNRSGEEDILDNVFPMSQDEFKKMCKLIKEEGDYSNNYLMRRDVLIDKLKQNKAPFKQLQNIDDFEL